MTTKILVLFYTYIYVHIVTSPFHISKIYKMILLPIHKIIVPSITLYTDCLATDLLNLKKITCTILMFDTTGWVVFVDIELQRFH